MVWKKKSFFFFFTPPWFYVTIQEAFGHWHYWHICTYCIVHLVPDANVHTDAGDDGDGEDNDFNAVVLINGCHDVIILLVQYFLLWWPSVPYYYLPSPLDWHVWDYCLIVVIKVTQMKGEAVREDLLRHHYSLNTDDIHLSLFLINTHHVTVSLHHSFQLGT